MNQHVRRTTTWLTLIVALTGVVIAGCGSSNSSSTASSSTTSGSASSSATTTGKTKQAAGTTVLVRGGKPVGGVKNITVNKGQPVRFTVDSDVSDEIHVHGYDFHKNVKKGGTVSFDFPAKIDGIFVIELESRGEQIASLKVNP